MERVQHIAVMPCWHRFWNIFQRVSLAILRWNAFSISQSCRADIDSGISFRECPWLFSDGTRSAYRSHAVLTYILEYLSESVLGHSQMERVQHIAVMPCWHRFWNIFQRVSLAILRWNAFSISQSCRADIYSGISFRECPWLFSDGTRSAYRSHVVLT